MYDLLIKNGTIVTSSKRLKSNLVIDQGVIVAITNENPKTERVINAKGKLILPGIIDIHCHLRDPGFEHKEDFQTGTQAAAAGGVTFVFPQPNLDPVPNTVENYKKEVEIGARKSLVDFNPIASPLLYEEGWVPKLAQEGTAWFKIFQKVAAYPYSSPASTSNTAYIYGAFKEIAKTGLRCSIHPFDKNFFEEAPRIIEKQGQSMTLSNYVKYISTEKEMTSAAYQLYYLAKKAGMKWYALHCIFPDYLELVRKIKASGELDVIATAETLWSMSDKVYDVKREEYIHVGWPPLNLNAVWRGVNDGTIDCLGTDHAPHNREEMMTDDPLNAHLGFPFLEWWGHMMLNEVNKGSFTLEKFVAITSENASKIFGFYPQKGAIQVGSDADVILVDLEREWTITSERVYTKCQLNPFHDWKIKGKVTHTILRGQVIMEEGEVMGKSGYGKFIRPIS
jgi:dihydroorotase (multifunctional complex type)